MTDYELDSKIVEDEDNKAKYAKLLSDFNDCRNELCLKCGRYKEDYLGACDDCRWRH